MTKESVTASLGHVTVSFSEEGWNPPGSGTTRPHYVWSITSDGSASGHRCFEG